VFVWDQRKV